MIYVLWEIYYLVMLFCFHSMNRDQMTDSRMCLISQLVKNEWVVHKLIFCKSKNSVHKKPWKKQTMSSSKLNMLFNCKKEFCFIIYPFMLQWTFWLILYVNMHVYFCVSMWTGMQIPWGKKGQSSWKWRYMKWYTAEHWY